MANGHSSLIETASSASRRRRVDWPLIMNLGASSGQRGHDLPAPKVVERPVRGQLASLLSAFDDVLALENPDAVLRMAVEVAREKIGLTRAAVFLLDGSRNMMLGTWGTDLQGAIVDEHRIMFSLSHTDREAFRRAREEGAHFTVFDACPIVEHRGAESRVVGRGWTAWTPIMSIHAPIGMLFNDAGLSGGPVDEVKQAHAAILCSLLGTILDPVRAVPGAGANGAGETKGRRLANAAAAMLADDPTMDAREIAKRLEVSVGWFARVFKAEMGLSLVEYRNRLRLDRVDAMLGQGKGRTTLLQAALAAGFGSYAQFHRVFRDVRRMTPRAFLQQRR
jgi:AraC-like DNA-binding protein